MPYMYPHAKGILNAVKEKEVDMAIASRLPTRDIAANFVDKLGIKSMFVAQEIFSGWSHKMEHFKKNQQKTQLPFNQVSKMGVTSILVNNG
ncbi:hypothetical protein L2E82_06595 [Cichorium intybus]|uniref:Uncharacterized protein n=1 Tax=Cichorium intybus TaxID=13427 RepID=A0ACB9HAX3_CICIN|nr:hypothetical protein L2E82_06595 [Cichorium intybus]